VWPGCQRDKKKRKRKQRLWAAAVEALAGCWAARPKGKRGRFVFFLFLFQTLFKIQIQIKFILIFSQNFINFLKVTQATKNHAKPNNDAQPLVVSILIKLSLIF
jgi:hypothetical protein